MMGRSIDKIVAICIELDGVLVSTQFVKNFELHHNMLHIGRKLGWTPEDIKELKIGVTEFDKLLSKSIIKTNLRICALIRDIHFSPLLMIWHTMETCSSSMVGYMNNLISSSKFVNEGSRQARILLKKYINLYNINPQISAQLDPLTMDPNAVEV